MLFFGLYNILTIIATLWTLARYQFQVSGDCRTAPPPKIPEYQLPYLSYAIIIDAGSSGSRIHVYNWKKVKSSELPNFQHLRCWSTEPGVSSCKSNSDIKAHLVNLLDAAKPYVPKKLQSITPIYFLATAG